MSMLAYFPMLLAMATPPCDGPAYGPGNAVLLPGSQHSVVVPEGWWLKAGSWSSRPELAFQLPQECEGGVWAYPELEVARLDDDERPVDLDDVGRQARESGHEIREAPVRTTIAGHDAVEYAATSTFIAHRIGGGGSLRPLYHRVIVIEIDDELFECRLTEDVIGDGKYHAAPRTLCASLAIRTDAKPYVP